DEMVVGAEDDFGVQPLLVAVDRRFDGDNGDIRLPGRGHLRRLRRTGRVTDIDIDPFLFEEAGLLADVERDEGDVGNWRTSLDAERLELCLGRPSRQYRRC